MKMTLMKRILAAATLLVLGIGTAAAQTENQGGFYVGGAVGQFDLKIDGLDGVDEAIDGLDADDTAWKAFVGWRFNPYLAVEAAYVDFGSPHDQFTATGSSGVLPGGVERPRAIRRRLGAVGTGGALRSSRLLLL